MNDELKDIIERQAELHAYDTNKPMTPFERILAYQAFIKGAEFIVRKSSYEKPIKKVTNDV